MKETYLGSRGSGCAQDVGVLNLLAEDRSRRERASARRQMLGQHVQSGGSKRRGRHCDGCERRGWEIEKVTKAAAAKVQEQVKKSETRGVATESRIYSECPRPEAVFGSAGRANVGRVGRRRLRAGETLKLFGFFPGFGWRVNVSGLFWCYRLTRAAVRGWWGGFVCRGGGVADEHGRGRGDSQACADKSLLGARCRLAGGSYLAPSLACDSVAWYDGRGLVWRFSITSVLCFLPTN